VTPTVAIRVQLYSFKLVKSSCHCDVWKYFSCIIVDVWNSLSDAVVTSTSVASYKNNLVAVDLSRFLTVV